MSTDRFLPPDIGRKDEPTRYISAVEAELERSKRALLIEHLKKAYREACLSGECLCVTVEEHENNIK